jgi:pSer/pThr/pTyr-binding forkhead associated (FHA) protein
MWLVGTSSINGNLPFRLNPGEYIIGRSPKSHIVLDDPAVSRRHARLIREGESVIVEDLKSRHGTFVNDEPAGPIVAQVGARLRFGSVLCLLAPVAMYPAPNHGLEDLTPAQQEVLMSVGTQNQPAIGR